MGYKILAFVNKSWNCINIMHFRRGGELLFAFSCLGGGGILEKLCLTLVTPWTVLPGCLVDGIFQARILE